MFKFGSSSKQETQYTDDRKPVNKEQKPGRNWKTFWRQKPSRSTEMATAGGAGNNSDGRRGHHKRVFTHLYLSLCIYRSDIMYTE